MANPWTQNPANEEIVRREYESSLSWRVTRPLRALGRATRGTRGSAGGPPPLVSPQPSYDSWLEQFHGDVLECIDAACAEGGSERFELFRPLDDDLWGLLLTQEYELYPHIRSLLPDVPEASFQELWNGASGARLAAQSAAFYAKLRRRFAEQSDLPLADARVLDFGCGWGRLTRFLARDVRAGNLYGCDPVEGILDVCRDNRVPVALARSDFLPERVPFDGEFDLAFSFSVFTHLSEFAHQACLRALHAALRPGGILVVTVRPPAYLWLDEKLRALAEALGANAGEELRKPRHLFVPHEVDAAHPQYGGGRMDYGEAVITLAYVRERWAPLFELRSVDLLIGDLHQVMLTLRRS